MEPISTEIQNQISYAVKSVDQNIDVRKNSMALYTSAITCFMT